MTYGQSCSAFQCNPNYGLTCGASGCACPTTQSGTVCDCSTANYWTGSVCTPRSTYLGSCTADYMCTYNTGLTCVSNKCICATANYYWTGSVCSKLIFIDYEKKEFILS